jgi:hypothetical protein
VEKERAPESVEFFAYDRGFSPMVVMAGLAVLALIAVLAWKTSETMRERDATLSAKAYSTPLPIYGTPAQEATGTAVAASSTDPLSALGPAIMQELSSAYQQLQTQGIYSSSTAQAVGASLAPYVAAGVQYPAFTQGDIKTDNDTSYARMLRYRSDLQVSLAPLLKNTEPEYEIFAYYVDTKDVSYLAKLRTVAGYYRAAASSTAQVVVPKDAVELHVAILNAMEEFAATLDALATHAQDPFASAALLSGYNQAERDMLTSFNDLTVYYKSKQP